MSKKTNELSYLASKKDSLLNDYQFLINLSQSKVSSKRKKVMKNYYEEELLHFPDFEKFLKDSIK